MRSICEAPGAACRHDVHVVLRQQGQSEVEHTFDLVPPVQEGMLAILPGETLYVEAEPVGRNGLRLDRVVPRPQRPERTLSFALEQVEGRTDMMLRVKNPFDRPLKFDLGLSVPDGGDQLLKAASCPIIAGGSGFEHWPHPVFEAVAVQFRLLGPNGPFDCD